MDIKNRIITIARKTKLAILIGDERYIKLIYRLKMGKWPDLKNPKTYNEKIQWLKLHDRKPEYTRMVDKYEAKLCAAQYIGQQHIIPTLGVWERFDEIDFDSLPEQFVLKCTHDSGGLVICRDKSKLDLTAAREKLEKSLKRNYYLQGCEWPYKNVKRRIIAEKYMDDENMASGLRDYKFFCFNRVPKLLYISEGLEDHKTASISFFDLDGNEMPFRRRDFKPMGSAVKFPDNMEMMKKIAQDLAEQIDSPFVRIDLYSIRGEIYFSEFTFHPCSGFLPFEPEQWDGVLGEWIDLSEI